jgi:hypothetical protein
MSSVESAAASLRSAPAALEVLRRAVTSPRFLVYTCCTLLALVTAWWLGKEMLWDTLDYHLYAGFSAIHDRFGVDYFAAGPQSYLNPYAYVPFYLLATSGLSALGVAAILAAFQSAILWLSYELAVALAPRDRPGVRVAIGAAAALLAFVNPVLIQQLGSSFADITTGVLALAGWVLIISAIRAPSVWRLAGAGFLLGAASALKLSNSLDALAVAIVPLFMTVGWRKRLGSVGVYSLFVGIGFILISLPWSLQLERHFGNPLFPLLNGIFRSSQYTTAPVNGSRFIPTSLAAALWRPFAMLAPVRMVHFETVAPDPRYAILLVLGALFACARLWRRWQGGRTPAAAPRRPVESRMLLALGCAFLINWTLWLSASGNSRYFLPVACIAAVLAMSLAGRLLAARPRLCIGAIAAILAAQIYQVQAGTALRPPLPWDQAAWFDVSVPRPIASQPALYLSADIQSDSFVAPYLAPGSGFINLEGDYVLGPDGANGAHVKELIRRFSPNLRVIVPDTRADADQRADVPHLENVNDGVAPFGLRVDTSRCVRIVTRYAPKLQIMTVARQNPRLPLSKWYTNYLVSCLLVPDPAREDAALFKQHGPNLVLDRLEDACPALLQPPRPVTFVVGDRVHGYLWVRRYSDTDVATWIQGGRVKFQKLIGVGRQQDLGAELAWEKAPLPVACGRQEHDDFFRVLQPR